MRAAIVTVAAMAAVGLGASTALAAAPAAKPTGPSVANTTQTLTVGMGTVADPYYSYAVSFTATTFTIAALSDSGTYTLKGMTLTLTIKKSAARDKGCVFPGTYDAATTVYAGTYKCRQNDRDSFTITTTAAS